MATSPAPNNALPVQRSLFDLKTMDTVTLKKLVPFTPVNSVAEASDRLQNNTNKLIEVINRGLRVEVMNAAAKDESIPWYVVDEDGKVTDQVFDGIPADEKIVNQLILTLAKSAFDYDKDAPIEERRAAKESAMQMIKDSPQIREGLRRKAEKAMREQAEENGE